MRLADGRDERGAVGTTMVNVASSKASLAPATIFAKGILCNVLVCLAVWIGFFRPLGGR